MVDNNFINTNFSNVYSSLQLLLAKAPSVGRAVAKELGGECVAIGKSTSIIPKKTGNMRSTARVESDDESVKFIVGGIIGNPVKAGFKPILVDYAGFINNGTSSIAPRFFMERILSLALTRSDAIYRPILESWTSHFKP